MLKDVDTFLTHAQGWSVQLSHSDMRTQILSTKREQQCLQPVSHMLTSRYMKIYTLQVPAARMLSGPHCSWWVSCFAVLLCYCCKALNYSSCMLSGNKKSCYLWLTKAQVDFLVQLTDSQLFWAYVGPPPCRNVTILDLSAATSSSCTQPLLTGMLWCMPQRDKIHIMF